MESIYSVSPAWFAHQSAQVQKGPTQMMRACKNSIFGKIRRRQTCWLVFAGSPVERTLGRNSHLDHLKFPDWRSSRGEGRSSLWEAASSTGSQLERVKCKESGAWIYGDKQTQVVGENWNTTIALYCIGCNIAIEGLVIQSFLVNPIN